jgi:acyl carrier protein
VLVTQRNLVHSTTARLQYYADKPVERFLLLSSLAFDSSVAGIFWSLCSGGTLVLPPVGVEKELDTLALLVAQQRVTHILLLPSLYNLLLNHEAPQLATLLLVIVAGESCPVALPSLHTQHLPNANLYNEYGPTEGTVWSTAYRFPAHWQGVQAPIGQPISNVQLYVLDADRQPVPIGVVGELHIGGEGITAGYWRRPELTADKFIANPFGSGKLYRSGDQVRWRTDGNLEFLGRIDQQVKIRGFRIELGEIEAALYRHSDIQEAVVIPYPDTQGHWQLAAYAVAHPTADTDSSAWVTKLRDSLATQLPVYMLPTRITCLPAMPLTPNGKLDRQALPSPDWQAVKPTDDIVPSTPVEIALAAIWQTLLNVPPVGRNADFFALGGHSLLLVQLAAQIREVFHMPLPLRTLYQASTLSNMATAIETAQMLISTTAAPALLPSSPLKPLPKLPHVRFTQHALHELMTAGELPPVQAAALTYWPDEVLSRYNLTREALLTHTFHDQPTVATIMVMPWGRIAIILLPCLLSELYVAPSLLPMLADALRLASSIGARCVSLTGLLPSATDYGRAIPPSLPTAASWPHITTGHAMTAAAVVLNIDNIVAVAGRALEQERVACLGLGSIGLTSLRLLLRALPHPRSLLLCDLFHKRHSLETLAAELVYTYGFQGEIQIVTVQDELPAALYEASLIIGATNVPDVLCVERLHPGTLIVDDSGPHCFNAAQALARLGQHADILFTEGGALHVPQGLQHVCHTPEGLEHLFADSGMIDTHIMMGCTLSSLLSALHDSLPPTLGMPETDECLAFYQAMRQLGVVAAPLRCDTQPLSLAAIEHFRQHFAPER